MLNKNSKFKNLSIKHFVKIRIIEWLSARVIPKRLIAIR